jgi:hypothetical protein
MGAANPSLLNEVDAPTNKEPLKGSARDKIQVE